MKGQARMGLAAARRWLAAGLMLVCSLGHEAVSAQTTLRHALWDANQRPLYQACAKVFEAANPGVRIRLQQLGWDEYWTSLATGFVSGTAPDVFTHHQLHFPEYVLNGVMADLSALATRDGVTAERYEAGLMDMWRHETRLYGLPLDWDTVALIVNLDMLKAAGLTLDHMRSLRWNPRDGGSFEQAIQRLTVDEQGRRAHEPGFDARRVQVHGFQISGPGGMLGQTEWSSFAASTGWRYQERPWDTALRYDDPRFIDTLRWFASLPARGFSATRQRMGKLGAESLFLAGRVAMVPSGAWMVGHFHQHAKFRYAWLPLPLGPLGQRTSMINSLALSIWSGSRNPGLAWRWLRYVGSRDCQSRVAAQGVVYPAVQGLGQVAVDVQRQRGVDAQVFVDAARGTTFRAPVVPRSAEVNDLMNSALERVLSGRASAEQVLPEAVRRIREITSQP